MTITIGSDVTELGHVTKTIGGNVRTKIPVPCSVIPSLPAGSYTLRLQQKNDGVYGVNHTVHIAKLGAGQPQK